MTVVLPFVMDFQYQIVVLSKISLHHNISKVDGTSSSCRNTLVCRPQD